MKKVIKNFSAVFFSFAIVATNSNVIVEAKTSEPINMYFNEDLVDEGQKPFIKDGRTYVPIRTIGDLLGVYTNYDNNTKTVEIKNQDTTLLLQVGSYEYFVNDVKHVSDSAIIMKSSKVYVPLRVVAETFGADISIDYETKNIIINFEGDKSNVNNEVDAEMLAAIKKDTIDLFITIINSEEFNDFKYNVINSEEFEEVLAQLLESETLESFLVDVAHTDEFKTLIELISSLQSFQTFIDDAKKIDSYSALEKKYGEDFLINQFMENGQRQDYVKIILGMLKDQAVIDFAVESLKLDSYKALKEDLEKVKQTTVYDDFIEICLESDYFTQILKEFVDLCDSSGLVEKMKKSPEGLAVIELFNEGVTEIYKKY